MKMTAIYAEEVSHGILLFCKKSSQRGAVQFFRVGLRKD